MSEQFNGLDGLISRIIRYTGNLGAKFGQEAFGGHVNALTHLIESYIKENIDDIAKKVKGD